MDLFAQKKDVPLAERLRPRNLDEVVGQEHLLGPGKPLRLLQRQLPNIVFWGPPGVGKTTIARLLADGKPFYQISAVLSGVQELRKIIEERKYQPGKAVIFVDEIHRWNKAQQDSLLPYVENGTFTLIGATTENPSFSLISPLLSRCKVFVLKSLTEAKLSALLDRALTDKEKGLGQKPVHLSDEARAILLSQAGGDGRRALNLLEMAVSMSPEVTAETLQELFQKRNLRYDKQGEQHYDTISAFIKSMRGSDPDAAVYYLARMYESGEDPRFLARRMIIFASEDVGMADPRALQVAVAAAEAYDRVGEAEGWIPLSNAAVYLATAPKSNSSYMAYKNAKADVEKHGDLPVPLHLRNAPTNLMKELGYGQGYQYAHNAPEAGVSHAHLPEEIVGSRYYKPTERGYEKFMRDRRAPQKEGGEA